MTRRSEMFTVVIAVGADAHPDRLSMTLESVARNTALAHELLVIPDDQAAKGAAAALNYAMRSTSAQVVVLLESGALVGPRWLEHLLAALDAPQAGIAGPSTNRAWNEQGVFESASQ